MNDAAIQGDAEAIHVLIQQLPPESKTLGDGLTDMVKNYRFDLISELLEQAGVAS